MNFKYALFILCGVLFLVYLMLCAFLYMNNERSKIKEQYYKAIPREGTKDYYRYIHSTGKPSTSWRRRALIIAIAAGIVLACLV